MIRKLFRNGRIFTPIDIGAPLAGDRQGRVTQLPRGAICVRGGVIEAIGDEQEVLGNLGPRQADEESGRGRVRVGAEDRLVMGGSVVYVAKNVEHKFHSIEEDLTLLVFFAPAEHSMAGKRG